MYTSIITLGKMIKILRIQLSTEWVLSRTLSTTILPRSSNEDLNDINKLFRSRRSKLLVRKDAETCTEPKLLEEEEEGDFKKKIKPGYEQKKIYFTCDANSKYDRRRQ